MLYLQLFISFFKIGLFGFGGGLAILSLIQMEVEQYGWMGSLRFGPFLLRYYGITWKNKQG